MCFVLGGLEGHGRERFTFYNFDKLELLRKREKGSSLWHFDFFQAYVNKLFSDIMSFCWRTLCYLIACAVFIYLEHY